MMQFKNVLAAAALALGVSVPAVAQTTEDDGLDYKPYPHMFVGVQGGAQTTFTNYDNLKLITPTASVSFGAFFTPVVGARLHFNGWQNKGGFKDATQDFKYDYKYATSDLDLMLNLSTLFGKKNYYPLNVYLIGGIGLNYAWDNDDAYANKNLMPLAYKNDRLSHNARVGAMLDWNLMKNLSLNLEVNANSLGDRYNSKTNGKDDWQLNAQVGLAVKFGYKKKEVKEEWATRVDTIWYDDVAYTPRVEDGTITWNVFYEIRESDFNDPDAQLANIGAFLKDHRECKVTIKSYADVQTGNPKINMGYSQQRSEKAVKALVDAGVDPSIIKAEYFGDTVQPFAENDKNRVSIITATGLKDVKDKYTVKKYRTKEVRYRVK
ncbi:MAG: OmpA family protein [Bacteroidaceae bacterium]|jgi:outer membrane protein OmpA-like peptidoglycan-associated protein|nr:OmpA family protein [Bacteroidaceae bacterium]MBR4405122.1 OmpA family protein [Bacteroidaceae bacterium]MBR4855243.1 OmpA family protein [Bacteroidaceae bacterium]MBR5608217.1 OmpA family protein [Bacteroidaceae bacterium]MEE0689864.1 OmpA family protein [Bacteroidaceae bacterium]